MPNEIKGVTRFLLFSAGMRKVNAEQTGTRRQYPQNYPQEWGVDYVGSGEGIGGYNLVCDINLVEENSIEECDLQN